MYCGRVEVLGRLDVLGKGRGVGKVRCIGEGYICIGKREEGWGRMMVREWE